MHRIVILFFACLSLCIDCAMAQSVGAIQLQGFDARAATTPSSAAAWGGQRSEAQSTLSDRVVHYEISAELDPVTHRIAGRQTLRWRNRSEIAISTVYLHLYLNAFANAGSTYMRETRLSALTERALAENFPVNIDEPLQAGEWGSIKLTNILQKGANAVPKQRFVQPDGGPATDQTVLALDLAQAIAPGAELELSMRFDSQLPRVIARTGYFKTFHMVAQWFPKMAVLELPGERGATEVRWNAHEFHQNSEFYADFGSFDVRLAVPETYTVAATGRQVELVQAGGKRHYRFTQADVVDFAWAADARFAPPLIGAFSRGGKADVVIKVFYTPDYAASAGPALAATLKAMRYAHETLGEYPFDTVSVIVPPLNAEAAGGMEYPTLFTVEGYRTVVPASYAAAALEFVTIHEFTHNYFQSILASNEFEEPFLDEAVNQYWNDRLLRDAGVEMPLPDFWQRLGFTAKYARFEMARWNAQLSDPQDALGQNSWARFSDASFGSVYFRGATMLRDLEARWGAALMTKAMRTYYQRWKFRHPSTADFAAVLSEVSNDAEHVQRVFAQNVYASGVMDDRVTALTSVELDASNASKSAMARFETVAVVRHFGVSQPQTLRVRFADGTTQSQAWQSQAGQSQAGQSQTGQSQTGQSQTGHASDGSPRWHRLQFFSRAQALSAELDPQQRYFLDQSQIDNTRTLAADTQASTRWWLALTTSLETFYALVLTL